MILLLVAGVFIATLSVILLGYLWINRRQLEAVESARSRLRTAAETPTGSAPRLLRDTSASSVAFLDSVLSGKAITAQLSRELLRAGWDTKPGAFLLMIAVAAGAGIAIGATISGGTGALIFGAVGALAPVIWLKQTQSRRLSAFQDQLPDAIDMVVAAMRAGYSFQAAMKFIGDEMPAPLGPEFSRFFDEQRLGMDVRVALLSLQDRVESTDLKMFITAVVIQRETGGNLAEVLTNISDVMRQRADVHREVETLTADSKLSARILSALPVFVFIAILAMNPDFLRPMIVEPIGRLMLAYAAISVALGYWMMMRISDIEF
jgi:tight adherence protein B